MRSFRHRQRPLFRPRRRHERRHDVVFYVPAIGSLLSETAKAPAGGAETQILMLAKALAGRGHRIAIIAYGRPRDLPREVEGITIEVRPPYRKRGLLLGKMAEMALIWRSLWRVPSRVVVTRCAGVQVGLIALYARISGRRMVFSSAADADFEIARLLPKRHDQLLYQLGVRLSDEVVVQTEEQLELCRRVYGRRPALIKSIATPAEPQEDPAAFLWVGRLTAYKRPLQYVALAHALPDATFWMVGVPGTPGPANDELAAALAEQAALTPNLTLLPSRSHADVGKLIAEGVAAVNTSDFEGMPNVLLEAWSRGVPALALNHDPGGVIVSHGLGDFAEGSFEVFVEQARAQWRGRHDRALLAERCRRYVSEQHSPTAVAASWTQVLRLSPSTKSARAQAEQFSERSSVANCERSTVR